MSKETTGRARLEPRTSRSEVRDVNRAATNASTKIFMAGLELGKQVHWIFVRRPVVSCVVKGKSHAYKDGY